MMLQINFPAFECVFPCFVLSRHHFIYESAVELLRVRERKAFYGSFIMLLTGIIENAYAEAQGIFLILMQVRRTKTDLTNTPWPRQRPQR